MIALPEELLIRRDSFVQGFAERGGTVVGLNVSVVRLL